jgi:hypothetical protein
MAPTYNISRTIKFQPHEFEAISNESRKRGMGFNSFMRWAAMRAIAGESPIPSIVNKWVQNAVSHNELVQNRAPKRWEESY